jgi:hypothetical protein
MRLRFYGRILTRIAIYEKNSQCCSLCLEKARHNKNAFLGLMECFGTPINYSSTHLIEMQESDKTKMKILKIENS